MKKYLKLLLDTYIFLVGIIVFFTILTGPFILVMSYGFSTKWLYLYIIVLPGLIAWLWYKKPEGL